MSASSSEEAAQRRELGQLVRQLTESGLPQLDAQLARRVRQLCRRSEPLVDAAYELTLRQLRRPHAERRLSALQLLDELFRRSHRLRQRAVADLQLIIDLCFETAGPLPAPAAAARRLTAAAAAALRHWHDTYADGYKKLAVAYRFLQQNRPGDLLPSRAEEEAARRAADAERLRLERLKQAKLDQLQQEIGERRDEIVSTMTQVESCFSLLLPDVALLDAGADSGEDSDASDGEVEEVAGLVDEKEGGNVEGVDSGDPGEPEADNLPYDPNWAGSALRGHGQLSGRHRVEVTLPARPEPLAITDDNRAVVETLRGLVTAVRRSQLPTVQRWIQLTESAGGGDDSLRQLMAVRDALGSALRRYEALQLSSRRTDGAGSSSDDSDWEEVPDAEDASALVARAASGTDSRPAPKTTVRSSTAVARPAEHIKSSELTKAGVGQTKVGEESTETGEKPAKLPEAGVEAVEPGEADVGSDSPPDSGSANERAARRARLLAQAPRLGYSADLVTWERGPGPAAGPAPHQCETARVWRSAADVAPPPAESADLRVTEFSGQFEPVEHRCGARLPSGRLCPRADRHKCPLHGPIVPRDEHGEPLSAELRQKEREARARGEDWQDPRLLAELRVTTGLDLTVGRGRRRRRAGGPGPGLTDLRRPASARRRLADKLFSAGTVRRLATALDRLDRRRHGDKFGDQFNYQVTGR
ncbi:UV-stimulated scaffold protein A-like [Amphibalanus amphitrite]|uniref:UV-stimulated scaffold protein A-like n=1 Tax=Amphibalanus amphitrite TaxID=1232801 RepID=UPI001C90FB99|nr:UV-stimulated scaffold protein A-like [Amphibalanus amphitrite]